MSDLREGLAKALLAGQIVFTHERAAINLIDELMKVIRQHDGHAEFVRVYNNGYAAGHHDTVEGQYTHILPVDMDTYHADVVGELLAELAKEQP